MKQARIRPLIGILFLLLLLALAMGPWGMAPAGVTLPPGMQLSWLGNIPPRSVETEALPSRWAVPGGHSIGVILQSDGIMVVGFAVVETADGDRIYPAREQGVEIADVIVGIDEIEVRDEIELARIIDERQGTPTTLHIIRKGEEVKVAVGGVYCAETDRFRIGLYVRDSVVGVGTLSFWDPQTGMYAALGHRIEDADTGQVIDVREGKLVSASIQNIKAGRPGAPGEKIGILNENGPIAGDITGNSEHGIFGYTEQEVKNPFYDRHLELAYAHQVQEGPAQMLTVINGQDIEAFNIYIRKLYPERQNGKDMVIQVTDPRLVSISGGIVQGMSGSPIIQNDAIVGVVTHVFLNDPLSGYGVLADHILSNMTPAG